MHLRSARRALIVALVVILGGSLGIEAKEIAPLRLLPPAGPGDEPREVLSERSLKLAIELDQSGARPIASSVEKRPFVRATSLDESSTIVPDGFVRLEIVLRGAGEWTFTRSVDFGPLCLEHPWWAEPHVFGDTILLHRDTFVIELPARAGLDRVEIATYRKHAQSQERVVLGAAKLDEVQALESTLTTGAVFWPEDFGDPDKYQVYGDPGEAWQRTNILIVPDGYTHAEKSTMKAHADQMVAYFRSKTPYKEHDRFLNYILVFAYSAESGTDQCDCAIVRDTAMATAFPNSHQPTSCGHSDNRCLYYGSGCDPTADHIAEAEIRGPGFDYAMGDRTIVMVNTTRYGGCGGTRAVYSAGNSSATEVAVHELGHSFAGLADEYDGTVGCGGGAGEINTSSNAVNGAWPEWIADLGAPWQGAQYYTQCLYRPQANCVMRQLGVPFCPVCNQRFSLVFFGKPRVSGTAPLASVDPATPTTAYVGVPKSFSVGTRFASGPGVTNDIQWLLRAPGAPTFTLVATGVTSYAATFPTEGTYNVRNILTGDTNFIKPSRVGANGDTYTWTVNVTLAPPTEVSATGSANPLLFTSATALTWDAAAASGSTTFDLYRGTLVQLASAGYGSCLASGLSSSAFDDPAVPPNVEGWFYLVSGRTSGGEGPLGSDSAGNARHPSSACP